MRNHHQFSQNDWDSLIVLIDKSQDVFWIASADYSTQIYVNSAFGKIWGYDTQALYENPLFWMETLVEEDQLRLANIQRLPHACVQEHYNEQYRIRRADGKIRWINDYTYPILNPQGECVGYAGIAQDITNELQLEQELQIAKKFLPKLAEKLEHTVFWVRDASLKKLLYISKAFEKISGRPIEFLYPDPDKWLETVVPEDKVTANHTVLEAIHHKPKMQFEDSYRIKRPDGEIRWIKNISFPIFEDDSENCIGFAGIAEDVTVVKNYERELQQAKEKAEAANIAKSNFIASLSHDFRTPLNGLLGMVEILQSGRMYPEQKEYIDAVLQSGNTLLELVEDIIDFVALDLNKMPLKEEWFNLEKLIEEISLTISPLAHAKKVQMIVSFSDTAPKEIYGDLNRVRRIIMNLVNNAVKFTPKGHVLINVEQIEKTNHQVWLQFMIEDTGVGIAEENFDFIFKSFNRIEPSYRGKYKGTGLGLTIVQQFMKDLGGKLEVKSQLNQGSIFICQIPFNLANKPEYLELSDHYSSLKTLIVDDFRKRAVTFAKQFGFKKIDIANSKNVHEYFNKTKEVYQLILIECEIKSDLPCLVKSIPSKDNAFLIMIGNEEPDFFSNIDQFAGTDFICKPLQSLAVAEVLENAAITLQSQVNKKIKKGKIKHHQVLLIEDDALTQKVTRWMLEELNCEVNIAGTGDQALGLLEKSFDLIIMDVGLPDIDGIELAKIIRNTKLNHIETPIIALTAHVMDQDKEKCLAAGMTEFLKKPLFKNDLKKLLLKIL